ncbi:MAG: acyl-CoA dehydrogenase family protein [Sulfurimonas sp.]|jgi:alkylation response protein AidB-like acyl-CoA dehydrogenase|nr:acyl-CoA dehydrogenase family protein [Sulfurimonas sp.]
MKNIYEQTIQFAKEHIEINTLEADIKAQFPSKSYDALKNNGYMGLLVPKEFSGQGLGLVEHVEVIQAIAQSCATTALSYMMHNVATMCIVLHGTKELKEEILPKIAKGEITLALAYSETGTGTHFYQPEIDLSKSGDTFILNGRKSFVTAAGFVNYYLVLSSTLNKDGLDNWLVPHTNKGVSFEEGAWDGLGMRGNVSMPMNLTNVQLSEDNRIGVEGSGLEQVFTVVAPFFITGLASVSAGIALNACEVVKNHAMQRKYTNGESLCLLPTVQNDLSKIYLKAQSAKHFTMAAANAGASGQADALTQIIAARINASELAIEVCTLAMKIGGGTAYAKRLPIERLLRDSLASQIMAPSVDVLSIWLGKAITNQQIP